MLHGVSHWCSQTISRQLHGQSGQAGKRPVTSQRTDLWPVLLQCEQRLGLVCVCRAMMMTNSVHTYTQPSEPDMQAGRKTPSDILVFDSQVTRMTNHTLGEVACLPLLSLFDVASLSSAHWPPVSARWIALPPQGKQACKAGGITHAIRLLPRSPVTPLSVDAVKR